MSAVGRMEIYFEISTTTVTLCKSDVKLYSMAKNKERQTLQYDFLNLNSLCGRIQIKFETKLI